MEFGIQVGNRLQGATTTLNRAWGGCKVVLSPRTFRTPKDGMLEESMIRFSKQLIADNAAPLIDPIMYTENNPLPQLQATQYFRSSDGDLALNYGQVVKGLAQLNERCGSAGLILPSHTLSSYDGGWDELQRRMIARGSELVDSEKLIPTIALSVDAVKSSTSIESIAENASRWGVRKVYLVCEHPGNYYLVDDAHWLTNVMRLAAWLKLAGLSVYMGYASHQMLVLALAKCDAMFAGGYLNMRRFFTEDFHAPNERTPSRRATWYYCPQVLSEYKLVTLDIAYDKEILGQLDTPLDGEYARPIFDSGALPSSTAYNETASFLHYLQCLKGQCAQMQGKSYEKTKSFLESSFSVAEESIQGLREVGIHDRDRSFADALSANEQAAAAFHDELGYSMSQLWDML